LLKEKGVQTSSVNQDIIVNLEIEDYDNYLENLQSHEVTTTTELSHIDVERIYNLLCYDIISKQDEDMAKYAPARSWGKLKTALNVWLSNATDLSRQEIYAMVVNDLTRPASVLRPLITQSLITYRSIRDTEVIKKQDRQQSTQDLTIPPDTIFVTDGSKKKYKKSAMEPMYLPDHMPDNERSFIDYLEDQNSVLWWYKNGDKGTEYLSIPYTHKGKQSLFYPDWIIKTKSKILILDTKSGITAKDEDTKYKAEALHKWLGKQSGIEGGIVRPSDGWFIHQGKKYSYDLSSGDWVDLNTLLR
jgi:type III restriction enzyme